MSVQAPRTARPPCPEENQWYFKTNIGTQHFALVTLYIKGVVATTPTSQKINISPVGVAWKEWTQKFNYNLNNCGKVTLLIGVAAMQPQKNTKLRPCYRYTSSTNHHHFALLPSFAITSGVWTILNLRGHNYLTPKSSFSSDFGILILKISRIEQNIEMILKKVQMFRQSCGGTAPVLSNLEGQLPLCPRRSYAYGYYDMWWSGQLLRFKGLHSLRFDPLAFMAFIRPWMPDHKLAFLWPECQHTFQFHTFRRSSKNFPRPSPDPWPLTLQY